MTTTELATSPIETSTRTKTESGPWRRIVDAFGTAGTVAFDALAVTGGYYGSFASELPTTPETYRGCKNPTELMTEFAAAFNRHDAAGLAQLFTAEAVFVNIFGMKMPGRTRIELGHRAAFDGRLGSASMKLTAVDRATIDPNVTILHAGWTLEQADASQSPLLVGACSGTLTAVARRDAGGEWMLVGATNVRETQAPS